MKNKIKGALSLMSLLLVATFVFVGCAKDKNKNNFNQSRFNNFNQFGFNNNGVPNISYSGSVYESIIGYENGIDYEMEFVVDVRTNTPLSQLNNTQPGQVTLGGTLYIFRDDSLCKLPIGAYQIVPSNQVNYSPGFLNGASFMARHQSGEEIRIDIPSAIVMAGNQTYYSRNPVSRNRQFSKVLSALGFQIARSQYNCNGLYSVSTPF